MRLSLRVLLDLLLRVHRCSPEFLSQLCSLLRVPAPRLRLELLWPQEHPWLRMSLEFPLRLALPLHREFPSRPEFRMHQDVPLTLGHLLRPDDRSHRGFLLRLVLLWLRECLLLRVHRCRV